MITFLVKDLHCGHCAAAVTRAVQAEDPSAQVSVDVATKRVAVTSQADPAVLATALQEAGYPAVPLAPDGPPSATPVQPGDGAG
ncbi:MAG: heavy-metal-associated domain-containing protein [Pseudomonadota bacterium]